MAIKQTQKLLVYKFVIPNKSTFIYKESIKRGSMQKRQTVILVKWKKNISTCLYQSKYQSLSINEIQRRQ